MRQKTITTKLLWSVAEVYYKVRQVLGSATVITKWDVTPDPLPNAVGNNVVWVKVG